MRKVIVAVFCMAGFLGLQSVSAQDKTVTFGVRGGLNISTMGGDYKDISKEMVGDDAKIKSGLGFNLGVIADIKISNNFYVQPGLFVTTKGFKAKTEYSAEDVSGKLTAKGMGYYLQIPILASYRFNLSDNVQWQINAGPYIACGLGGKWKLDGTYTSHGESDTEKSDGKFFGTDEPKEDDRYDNGGLGIKRFDFGLAFGTGVMIKKIYVGLQYDLGLINVADPKMWGEEGGWDKDQSLKTRNLSVSVGYNF